MAKGQFLFLGTGGSSGIPMIGCTCPICTSNDPRNQRLRPSGLLTCSNQRILIDAGPDFRCQALHHLIIHLDGVLITHSHFDHIAGLDELRIYYLLQHQPLPVLLSEPTYRDIQKRFDYFFQERSHGISLPAQLKFQVIHEKRGKLTFLGIEIGFTRYEQAGMSVTGFRIGDFAYISDIRLYPETIFEDLAGVETLCLGMLREETSRMHFNLDEAIAFSQKIGAQKTYFTHMSHEVEHAAVSAKLPEGFYLAYDGLTVDFVYG